MNLFKKISLSLLAVIGLATITACGESFDKDKGYTDITSKLSLSKDYEGKDYFKDGIALVEVERLTDGDTSTFRLPSPLPDGKASLTVRYHGINTPESTGSVEKWGKSASKYNANRLSNAYQIVVEAVISSTTGNPDKDSNGTRYLGYVWYRNSATDTFKNLNLELVENGYTDVHTPKAEYQATFKEALAFAKKNQMHIWSNDNDPNYSSDPVETTVEGIVKDLALDAPTLYSYDTEVGAKIVFEATILNHTSSDTHYYTVGAIGTDGKLYTMNMYGAYSSAPINSYLVVGSTYHFVATIQRYYGKFQISGIDYLVNESLTHVISSDDYHIFDANNSRFRFTKETAIHGYLDVQTAELNGTTLKIVGTALDTKGQTSTQTYTVIVNNVTSYDASSLVGKSISAEGFKNANGEIVISSINSIKVQ